MVVKKYHTSIILFVALMTGCASFPSMNDSCGQNGNWTVMSAVGECIEAPKVVEMPSNLSLLYMLSQIRLAKESKWTVQLYSVQR